MSELVFRRILTFALRNEQTITLGGGEPTIHPQFWPWMQYARKRLRPLFDVHDFPAVGLVTNGSNTELSLKLADLAKRGKIWAAVSQDRYHDEIDPRVFNAFRKPEYDRYGLDLFQYDHTTRTAIQQERENDRRDIRSVDLVRPAGRARSWGDPRFGSFCCGIHIDPSGKMWECQCRKNLLYDFSLGAGRNYQLPDNLTEYDCQQERIKYEKIEAEQDRKAKQTQLENAA